ncbi:hypothetical protein [Ensifer sp. Root278]|uniref:hypothetical protein n=1 Tax=Ensifer sp. Root278 TaxID=1736509 RepID=UPI00070D3A1C|nr:hypothetical protein [Ensifer sp. Root278]KRD71807.1 hypothetical protein ASE60_24730 [Ensifer sp. Root278]
MSRVRKKKEKVDLESAKAAYADFERATSNAVTISQRNLGMVHTGRQRRALSVFTKLIMHNMSISVLADRFFDNPSGSALLDHYSLAVLARASIDASLMTMYISEPSLSTKQWDLRRQLLFLHDDSNRKRFLKPLKAYGVQASDPANDGVRLGIQTRIRELGAALLYSEPKIAEFQNGMFLFLDGVRGAVREAGWSVDDFDFNQSYLSAYVHTHPVSFMRFDEQLRVGGISPFQADFCHYLFSMLQEYTQSVVDRMDVFSVPDKGDPNGHIE